MTMPRCRYRIAARERLSHAALLPVALLASLLIGDSRTALGGAITWNGNDLDGLWTSAGNWDGGLVPGAGDSVVFDLPGGDTIDHDAPAGTIYLQFDITTDAGSFTFNGNALSFEDGGGIESRSSDLQTFNVDIEAQGDLQLSARFGDMLFTGEISVLEDFTIFFEAGGTITISGFISGEGGINIVGGGTVIMEGADANTFTGNTSVSNTTLILAKDAGDVTNDFGSSIQGNLFINANGTVQLGEDHQISNESMVTINNGTLDMDEYEDAVGSIVFFSGGNIIGDADSVGIGLHSADGIVTTGTGTATISSNLFLAPANPGDNDARRMDVGTNAPLIISGIISDGFSGEPGAIEKLGEGALTLSGANTYTGGTTINAGAIITEHEDALGTGDVTINAGQLRGIANIGGNLTLNAGRYRPTTGATVSIAGNFEINGGEYSPQDDTQLLLAGDLLQAGGTVTSVGAMAISVGGNYDLLGGTFNPGGATNLSISGDFTIDGGEFLPENTVDVVIDGDFNLLSGLLAPEGATTLDIAGNLNIDGGDFAPTTSIDLLLAGNLELRSGLFSLGNVPTETTIGGDFLFDGGTWQVAINDAGDSTLLIASSASLFSGTILAAPQDPIRLVREYVILQTDDGILGNPEDIEKMISDESFLLDFRLLIDGNDLILRAIPGATFANAIEGTNNPNLPGIAAALDPALADGLGGATMANLQMLDQAGVVRTLEQLQPQIYQATTEVLRRQQRVINAGRLSRLSLYRSRLRDADRAVRRSALASADVDSPATAAAIREIDRYPDPVGTWTAWGRVLNDFGRIAEDRAGKRFSWNSHGLDVGAEKMISRELILGGSLSGLWSKIRGREQSGDNETISLFGTFYVGWLEGPWNLDAGLSYGHAWNDASRPMTLLNLTASQRYQSDMYGGFAGAGYHIGVGDWDLEPYTTLEYSNVRDRGFTEGGAGDFNLRVSREVTDSLRQSFGLRVARTFESSTGRKLRPRANIAWEVEYLDAYTGRTAAIFDNSFRTRGQRTSRSGIRFGAGFDWILHQSLAFVADYDLTAASELRSHVLNLGVRWQF